MCANAAPASREEIIKTIYPEVLKPLDDLLKSSNITKEDSRISYLNGNFQINERSFNYSYKLFIRMLVNTFADCNDMNDLAKTCQAVTLQGFEKWINASKDKSISSKAWESASYNVVYTDVNPEISTINFGIWADRAYELQRKMNDDEKLKPLHSKLSKIQGEVYKLNAEIEKEQKKFFKNEDQIKALKIQKNQKEYEAQGVANQIRIEKQKAP